jgi:hypothetical protein
VLIMTPKCCQCSPRLHTSVKFPLCLINLVQCREDTVEWKYSVSTKSLRGFEKLCRANKFS